MNAQIIETMPQAKRIFAKETQTHIHELKNKILELDVSLPNFHEQLDRLIAINKLLQDAAVSASFYTLNSPFAEIIHHFEEVINLLRDRHSDIDWITKELLLEAVNMSSQIINEYCLGIAVTTDWSKLQHNLFTQINDHLLLKVDEFTTPSFLSNNDNTNEPFNLDDTPEALHLFDIDFDMGFDIEDNEELYQNDQLDNSGSFLVIQLDSEENYLEKSTELSKDISDSNDDDLETLFPSLFTEDLFTEDLDNLDDLNQADDQEDLPMPEILANIFSAPSPEQLLGNDDETELQRVKSDNNIDIADDLTPYNFFEPLEEDDNIFENLPETNQDLELDLSSISSDRPKVDSSLVLTETLQQSFSTSDIDTYLEESPIYQNNISPSWEDLSQISLDDREMSYSEFSNLSLSKNHALDRESGSQLATVGDETTIRIPINHLEMFGDLSEELLVRRGILDIYLGQIRLLSGEAQQHLQSLEPDSVSQIAIANLQNTFQQIVNVLDLTEQQNYALSQDVRHLRKILCQVLKHPISSLVRKFPRILRDLSLQYGKQVEMIVQGAEVSIERSISEIIAEPLELLLRNAFEHGIESPQERQHQGKTAQGKIEFIATQTDENTIIKISDDGRGIDIDRIRHQVEESATIVGMSSFSTMDMSDEQLLGLIFEPNFNLSHSNTETGTKLSGVRKQLRKFGGSISVQSQRGRGTQFTLVLPNMLSLIRVLLINIDQMCLAIPSKIILEVISMELPDYADENQETLRWGDRLLPVVRLNSLLKLNCRHSLGQSRLQSGANSQFTDQPESQKSSSAVPSFLVIHYENDFFALQTDGCWNDQEATFHQIEGDIILPQIFLGTVILGNNQAVALINPHELVSQCLQSNGAVLVSQAPHENLDNLSGLADFFEAGDTLPEPTSSNSLIQAVRSLERSPENLESSGLFTNNLINGSTKRSHQPKILIVESSANIRRYLAMTLTKSGFLTEQVQDGKEAIAFLQKGVEIRGDIDAVITDLEMPHMDGFKLLSSIRADANLHNLPIVVLTARNNENDQKLALDLGANAYFSKPYREEELVKMLQQLVA
ncbi:MAG: response regulator [Pseudanabaena sp. CAN_BIN31]|nr:response regulator [Pseudanabaena sp. CAN_BIN31]